MLPLAFIWKYCFVLLFQSDNLHSYQSILSISIVCFIVNSHCVLTRGGVFSGWCNCLEGIEVMAGHMWSDHTCLGRKHIKQSNIEHLHSVFYSHQSLCINEGGYYQGGVVVWRGLNSWQVIFGQIIYDYDDNIQTSLKHTNTMKHHSSIYSISAKTETCSHSKFH